VVQIVEIPCRCDVDHVFTAQRSSRTLNYAARVIRRHRKSIGSRWWKLAPGQQAILVLVQLRKGETFPGLTAGFGVGTATAWR
jgi:hypothetical protein